MYKDKMPTNALICYCPDELDQPIPNVDLMVEKGCSGQLAIEEPGDTIVLQLLGASNKTAFEKRFNDLSLTIVSNCETTKEIASTLNANYHTIQSLEQIQLLSSSGHSDVVFVDFTGYDHSWDFINDLISSENVNHIQCIVSPYDVEEDKLNTCNPIVPRQSYLMKDGSVITNISKHVELMYAYYHSGSGRTDNSTRYSLQNIKENSGNRKILAWHFLAEIGHKLGFVPKYGA